MLLEIQDKAFNPQQVVSMVKNTKYNNIGNATLYRLNVQTERETFEFIYPNDKQSRDEDFDKIIDAANGKQADIPQTDCDKCIWNVCNYNRVDWEADTPQTERIKTPDYCDICNHKGCDNCIANNLDDYCVPSGYAPKDTPQTDCGGYDSRRDYEYDKALDEWEGEIE